MTQPTILWFRQDLRLTDLPALQAAVGDGRSVLPVYILDDSAAGAWLPGSASRWWLHHSLTALREAIRALGGELIFRSGDSMNVLKALCSETGAREVHCSRRYEPWAAEQEVAAHDGLKEAGITLRRYPGALLHEPGTVLTQGGDPFKVFTPFWRACQRAEVPTPRPMPEITWHAPVNSESLDAWKLRPSAPDWAEGWDRLWSPGEAGANERLELFLESAVDAYADARDLPAVDATSRLSPHLHHGEISPRQIWARCEAIKAARGGSTRAVEKFQAELGWREFSYHLLHFFPSIPERAFKDNFEAFPWRTDAENLRRWQRGQTGYPIVDAGMRELWHTGYMHNRVRMVVASFLCKHLLLPWRAGEDWFWDTLVDADLASNSCSWQWVAGSGADAAPYFRIFNPMTQGEKFDKAGAYVRRWVPEIAALPDKYLHTPWETPADVLEHLAITLGDTYPEPIVNHRDARQSALDAYEVVKVSNTAAAQAG